MTTGFWILAALLVVVALAMVIWPLLRAPRGGAAREQTALLREQLDALKSAHAAGLVDDNAFAARQQALSAAALALIDAPPVRAGAPRASKATALLLVLALPMATFWLYDRIGTPNAIGFAGPGGGISVTADGDAATSNAPDLVKAAEALAAKLATTPDDGEGWALLARTYNAIERFPEASAAFVRARALLPEDPVLLVESAWAMGRSTNPASLRGEPEKLVDRAIELNPTLQDALFLKGMARAQAGDLEVAEATWERLLGLMEVGSPSHQAVSEQLNNLRERLGKEPMEAAAAAPVAPPAPANATPDANAAGIDVTVTVAPELADLVQPGDTLFVFARAEAGPPAPLAIQRRPASALPLTLRLDESMGMIAGMSLAQFPRVIIGARLSRSGNAQAQPGDLEGLTAAIDWRATGKVDIVIGNVR